LYLSSIFYETVLKEIVSAHAEWGKMYGVFLKISLKVEASSEVRAEELSDAKKKSVSGGKN